MPVVQRGSAGCGEQMLRRRPEINVAPQPRNCRVAITAVLEGHELIDGFGEDVRADGKNRSANDRQ